MLGFCLLRRTPLLNVSHAYRSRFCFSTSASAKARSSSKAKDDGVWSNDHDLSSLAVMGPNLKWQVVRDGGSCVQMDKKPKDFTVRVCSLDDIAPNPGTNYIAECPDRYTAQDAFFDLLADNLFLQLHPGANQDQFDEQRLNLINETLPEIGLYRGHTNAGLDKDSRRLLAYYQRLFDDDNEDEGESYSVFEFLSGSDALSRCLLDLPGDEKWARDIAVSLHRQGWQVQWEHCVITWRDAFGVPDCCGEIYLEGGVTVDGDDVWNSWATPYLYLPCFPGEDILTRQWLTDFCSRTNKF